MAIQNIFENIGNRLLSASIGMTNPAALMELNKKKATDDMDMIKQMFMLDLMQRTGMQSLQPSEVMGQAQQVKSMPAPDLSQSRAVQRVPQQSNVAQQKFQEFIQGQYGNLVNQIPQSKYALDPMSGKLVQTPENQMLQDLYKKSAEVPIEAMKQTALAKEKEYTGAKSSVGTLSGLYDMYLNSVMEKEQKYPGSSDATPSGRLGRIGANLEAELMQTLPYSQAFQTAGRKMAYEMARAIEGGRVTDQDVDIVFNSLFNSNQPKKQATIQVKAYIKSLKNKGLSDKELEPLQALVDMSSGEIMQDKDGNVALMKNGKVLRVLGEE